MSRGGSSVGAGGAQAPLPPQTPWKVEVRRREKKRKERREEEERGAGGRRRETSPPQKANLGSATGHEYHAEIDKNILLESHTQWKDKSM